MSGRHPLKLTIAGSVWVTIAMMGGTVLPAGEGLHPYPLWPSTPVPGWPGVDADEDHTVEKRSNLENPNDLRPAKWGQPEFLAYPGAVHHLRDSVQRYIPPYPLYNHKTLVKNFILHEMEGHRAKCVDFAEPVYFHFMYGGRSLTKQRRPPVKSYPWKPGAPPIKLDLGQLERSLYVMRPIVANAETMGTKPNRAILIKMRVNDRLDDKEKMNAYLMRAVVIDNFYTVQHFYFHSRGDGRNFRAEFEVLDDDGLDLRLHNIDLHDHFGEVARQRGKTLRVLSRDVPLDRKKLESRWAANKESPKLKRVYERLLKTNPNKTPEEQRAWDDAYWRARRPLNTHSIGWVFYLRNEKDWQERWRLCPVPEEWDDLRESFAKETSPWLRSWFLDLRKGIYYVSRGGRHPTHHDSPPPFELRGANVYEKGEAGKLVGPLADFTSEFDKYYRPVHLLKDGKRLREWKDLEVRDALLFKDGEPYSDEGAHRDGKRIQWVQKKRQYLPIKGTYHASKYYDARLRDAFLREVKVKPGIYYDAARSGKGLGVGIHQHKGFVSLRPWIQFGHRQTMRDHAMRFIRGLYDVPAVTGTHRLAYLFGLHGLHEGLQKNGSAHNFYYACRIYDALYDFLATDKELAAAVSRYLPWIKTPDDVIKFADTYLLQDMANRMMKYRFYLDHQQAEYLTQIVLAQDDTSISDPWMDFLFTRGWEYPQALSGLGDNLVTSTDRDGGTTIGSFFYGRTGGIKVVNRIKRYLEHGGNPKYDVTDPREYVAIRQKPYLQLEGHAAGRINPGVGDVGGIAEHYGRFAEGRDLMAAGWQWHQDPKFAWELRRCGRQGETEEEWASIIEAAKKCPRDPFTLNRSRVLSGWGAYLTSGTGAADHRFLREAVLRLGVGYGHHHHDTLDLRLFAFGCTMANDFNQRLAYGRPAHRTTRLHNLVEVDGQDWFSHSWAANLFDAPGSPYVRAESVPPYNHEGVKLFRRQMALVNVDAGREGTEEEPGVLPSSYVFDVFRVSGGTMHTYCFHGCADDAFEVNVRSKKDATGEEGSPDGGYLNTFSPKLKAKPNEKAVGGIALSDPQPYWVGRCDGRDLVATWRLDRKAEQNMLRHRRDEVTGEPRKYTRLTLLGQKRSRIMHAFARDKSGSGYYGRCLYAQRGSRPEPVEGAEGKSADAALDSAFVALIEAYAGEPSIIDQRRLRIADNEADALRAVAVEVKTRNGHTDLLFADGRPEKLRTVVMKHGFLGAGRKTVQMSGEYAYFSLDTEGLRQVTLSGGTRLSAPSISIEIETPRYQAVVKEVDCLDRKVVVEGAIPERLAGHFFEVGNDLHRTSYETEKIEADGDKTVITMRKGLEIMRTRVREAAPETGKVIGAIAMLRHRGRDQGLVASNDDLTKFWRVAYSGGNRHSGHEFTLTPMDAESEGPVFTKEDFPASSGLRVWEFGKGDFLGIQTGVSLRRLEAGGDAMVYDVLATSPCKLALEGTSAWWSAEGKTWQELTAEERHGRITIPVGEAQLADRGRCRLKVGL